MKPVTIAIVVLVAACGAVGGGAGLTMGTRAERSAPPERILDAFDDAAAWKPVVAQGVSLKLAGDAGAKGQGLLMDFSFPTPSGYVVAGRDLPVTLPEDYKITFMIRGEGLENTLEFKFIDKDGNTFWKKFENYSFPGEWKKVSIRKSQIVFAWGPAGGGALTAPAKVEIAVSCGKGGSGKVWIDELALVDLSAVATKFSMTATASESEGEEMAASRAVDDNPSTRWSSPFKDGQWLEIDLGSVREFVGMMIRWEAAYAKEYSVVISGDRKEWTEVFSTSAGDGDVDDIYFGLRSARYVKILMKKRGTEWGNSIWEIRMKGPEDEIRLAATSEADPAGNALDGRMETAWTSRGGGEQALTVDMGRERDLGGVHIHWGDAFAAEYDVAISLDGETWSKVYGTARGNGRRDRVVFKEAEARFLRIAARGGEKYSVREVEIKGIEAAGDRNKLYEIAAEEAPRGFYPKYFLNEASYWTLAGVTEDVKEALVNEEGAFEVDKEQFSIEPFLRWEDKLVTWADVKTSQGLEKRYIPIPDVRWEKAGLEMRVRVFGHGIAGASSIYATYTVTNRSAENRQGKLYLAIRPFQVNPPWQKLNMQGGVAKISKFAYDGSMVRVNGSQRLCPLTKPSGFGAVRSAEGDITDFLAKGELPPAAELADEEGFASAALAYDFSLQPNQTVEYALAVPMHDRSPAAPVNVSEEAAAAHVAERLEAQIAWWEDRLDRVVFRVPEKAREYIDTLKSNLAYIFLNRDGFRIQPGSRSYLRSWIRDGALTSAAFLRMGNFQEVREYLGWYGPNIFPDGRVPCVVDDKGMDGVPENDSNGEYLYGFLQYYNFTKDKAFLSSHFDRLRRAADFIIAMCNERRTDEFKNGPPEKKVLYGLVPQSISHEGYSAKPMHSYWDDFLSLKGLKDMATICEILGKKDLAAKYAKEAGIFRRDIVASMELCMKIKGLDYLPAAAELGDFDPTSTSIALFPSGEMEHLPKAALERTFERYWSEFQKRLVPGAEWGEAYTPYEIRNCQTFILMGKKDRAHKLFEFFFTDQRPAAWNHWSEIVFRDPKPGKWIGDMPHTWLGSDYIKAVRSLFVYEKDAAKSLILGAGIPEDWLEEGLDVGIEKAPTYWGVVNFTARREGDTVKIRVSGDAKPPGGFVVKSPRDAAMRSVKVNGKPAKAEADGIHIAAAPVEIEIGY